MGERDKQAQMEGTRSRRRAEFHDLQIEGSALSCMAQDESVSFQPRSSLKSNLLRSTSAKGRSLLVRSRKGYMSADIL